MSNMYKALLGAGGIIGGVQGFQAQQYASEHYDGASDTKSYMLNTAMGAGKGIIAGSGAYGLGKMLAGTASNMRVAGAIIGIGAGLGAIYGVNNQLYASKHYNSPEFGPGEARADASSLIRSGAMYAAGGAVAGLGVHGAMEVAQSLLKGM